MVAKKGEVKEHRPNHEGEEFIYVLKGVMEFKVGNKTYELQKGDSLYFNSLENHGMMPVSDEVIYLDVFV